MSEAKIAGANINIPKQIYVGAERGKPFNTVEPPLAFAANAEAEGLEKRLETMRTWMGPPRERRVVDGRYVSDENGRAIYDDIENYQGPVLLDNIPQSGFTFEKSVSRWTTSNKWFTINDPRGFQLQIAADNLGDIILNSGVVKGELQGEYVWARNKGTVFLCRTSHPTYQRQFNLIERTTLIPGDVILMGQDTTEWEYLGNYYTVRYGYESRYVRESSGEILAFGYEPTYNEQYGVYNYTSRSPYNSHKVSRKTFLGYLVDERQVFAFRNVTGNGSIKLMRSKPTRIQILREGNPSFTIMEGSRHDIWTNLPANFAAVFFSEMDNLKSVIETLTSDEAVKLAIEQGSRNYFKGYDVIGQLTA